MNTATNVLLDTELRSLTTSYLAYCLFLERLEADPAQDRTLVYAVRIGLNSLRDEIQTALEAEGILRWSQLLKLAMARLMKEAGGNEDCFLKLVPMRI